MSTNFQLSPLGRGCSSVGYKKLIPWFTDPPASDFLLHNAYFWLQMNKMNYLKCPCKFRKKKNNPDLGD